MSNNKPLIKVKGKVQDLNKTIKKYISEKTKT